MINDPFSHSVSSTTSPAENCFAVTPDDALLLPGATKAIYVGEGGDVVLVAVGGNLPVTFRNVGSGAILDVRAKAIWATGTTAADLVGLA